MVHGLDPRFPEDRDWLVAEWLRHETLGTKYSDEDWASDMLDELIADEPDLALSVIIEVLHRAPTASVRSCIAAGPMEDLLSSYGGKLIGRIEGAIANDRCLREALSGVWLDRGDAGEWFARGDADHLETLRRYRALGVPDSGTKRA